MQTARFKTVLSSNWKSIILIHELKNKLIF